jgi:putative transcriptional regulator
LAFLIALPLTAQSELAPAEGRVLVADRKLADPNFANTVVILLTYSDSGAGGVVVNGPTKVTVERALAEFPEARGHSELLYDGGPVDHRQILALAKSTAKLEDAELLVPGVYKLESDKALRKALASKMDVRVYAGYAGWGPGQLESEIDAGAWHILKGDAKVVFDPEPETQWKRLFEKFGLQLAGNATTSRWILYKEQPGLGWKGEDCGCVFGGPGVPLLLPARAQTGLAATLRVSK